VQYMIKIIYLLIAIPLLSWASSDCEHLLHEGIGYLVRDFYPSIRIRPGAVLPDGTLYIPVGSKAFALWRQNTPAALPDKAFALQFLRHKSDLVEWWAEGARAIEGELEIADGPVINLPSDTLEVTQYLQGIVSGATSGKRMDRYQRAFFLTLQGKEIIIVDKLNRPHDYVLGQILQANPRASWLWVGNIEFSARVENGKFVEMAFIPIEQRAKREEDISVQFADRKAASPDFKPQEFFIRNFRPLFWAFSIPEANLRFDRKSWE
jgi:hypothetical protein